MEPQVDTGIVSPAFTGYQTPPGPNNVREHFKGVIAKKLGIAQLVIGILCVLLQIVWFVLVSEKADDDYSGVDGAQGVAYVGSGLWCGTLFTVGGVLGIMAGKRKTVCYIVTLMVWSILCATFTTVLLSCTSAGLAIENDNSEHWVEQPVTSDYDYGSGTGHYAYNYEYVKVITWTPVMKGRLFVMAILLCLSITSLASRPKH